MASHLFPQTDVKWVPEPFSLEKALIIDISAQRRSLHRPLWMSVLNQLAKAMHSTVKESLVVGRPTCCLVESTNGLPPSTTDWQLGMFRHVIACVHCTCIMFVYVCVHFRGHELTLDWCSQFNGHLLSTDPFQYGILRHAVSCYCMVIICWSIWSGLKSIFPTWLD